MPLPVLGRKIFLLLADVEDPLNALKILYWLVRGKVPNPRFSSILALQIYYY